MDLTVVGKSVIEQCSDPIVDAAGNRIPAKPVIFVRRGLLSSPKMETSIGLQERRWM